MPRKTTPKNVTAQGQGRPRRSPMEHPRHQYPQECAELQSIARSCGLGEEIKWGKPCFTFAGHNIVLIQRFNNYIALLFFKGALLTDPGHLLHRVGAHMQVPRQLRFTSLDEIVELSATVRAYIEEAVEIEKSGAKIAAKQPSELTLPPELQAAFEADPALHKAFTALTPGRQKAYIYRIAAAKQSSTRASRVKTFTPQILAGKGLNE